MEHSPILMTEEYWANSQLSIVRYCGHIKAFGQEYIIVNQEGKDIFECSVEAARLGRDKAIPAGEPCDLIDKRYVEVYRKIGRDKFIVWVKDGLELKEMKERLKQEKKNE